MDGDDHQEKHTYILWLIFLFASSRGAGRFIWKNGNEGGAALVKL
jgi:TM2 domain-containing membrane protein YozV